MEKRMKTKKAFTLIELMMVVVIIGTLASIGVVAYNSAQKSARDAKRIADLNSISGALTMYGADHGRKYPNTPCGNQTYSTHDARLVRDLQPYLAVMPSDPSEGTKYNTQYLYVSEILDTSACSAEWSTSKSFTLFAFLENSENTSINYPTLSTQDPVVAGAMSIIKSTGGYDASLSRNDTTAFAIHGGK